MQLSISLYGPVKLITVSGMQADPPARQLPPPGHDPPSHFSKVQQRGGIPSHATNATLRRHRPFNCKYEDLLACRVQTPASPFATRSYHVRHCVFFGELPISVKSGEQGRAPFTTLASFGPGARPSRTGCPACRALDSREVEQGLLHPLSNKQTLEVEAGPGTSPASVQLQLMSGPCAKLRTERRARA